MRKWTELSLSEQDHLVWTMRAEARGEGDQGMAAVAWVIRNRSNHAEFPKDIAKIVTRKMGGSYEFSPWGDDSLIRHNRNTDAYQETAKIAQQVFDANQSEDITFGATFFESTKLKNSWMEDNSKGEIKDGIQQSRLIKGTVIGNHQFYNLSHYYYAEIKNKGENPVTLRDGSTYDAPKNRLSILIGDSRDSIGDSYDSILSEIFKKLPIVPTTWHPPLRVEIGAFKSLDMNSKEDIKKVQILLEKAGLATDKGGADENVDGIMGSITQNAIKTVERKIGSEINGIMDAEVWKALQDTARLTAALEDQNRQTLCNACNQQVSQGTSR